MFDRNALVHGDEDYKEIAATQIEETAKGLLSENLKDADLVQEAVGEISVDNKQAIAALIGEAYDSDDAAYRAFLFGVLGNLIFNEATDYLYDGAVKAAEEN